MTKQSEKTEHRITKLEECYNNLFSKVDEIANNHLAHLAQDTKDLRSDIQKIDMKLAYWSGGIVTAVAIIQYLLK